MPHQSRDARSTFHAASLVVWLPELVTYPTESQVPSRRVGKWIMSRPHPTTEGLIELC